MWFKHSKQIAKFQALWKGHKARLLYRRFKAAARLIQRRFRSHLSRTRYLKFKSCIVRVQAMVKRYLHRRRKKCERAARRIQGFMKTM